MKFKEKLSDKCNQPPILEFEGFVIRPFDGHSLFMEHPNGEGTQVSRMELLLTLTALFQVKF